MRSKPNAPMATIVVEGDSLSPSPRYIVHEYLLVHYSPFFKAALQGNFAEAESKTVTLNAHPIDIEHCLFWIYHQRFPDKDLDDSDVVDQWSLDYEIDKGAHRNVQMISLYLFCDKYDVPDLKAALIDELFTLIAFRESALPTASSTKDVFDKLPDNDPLCQFLVDVHCLFASVNVWNRSEATDFPWAFVSCVLARYTGFAQRGLLRKVDFKRCDYHGHQDQHERDCCRR